MTARSAGGAGAQVIAERLTSFGTLVAGFAHEINNPITYVLANLGELERLTAGMREAIERYRHELLARDAAAARRIADIESKLEQAGGVELLDELLSDALEGALRIRDLVRDLLSLSSGTERSTAPVRVHEVLDSTLRLISRQVAPVAELVSDYGATTLIDADPARLGQIFLNLLTNALQACREAPAGRECHEIRVVTRDEPGGVRVEIEDTGPGIPEALRPRVFSPFFTTKRPGEGTGLGLYITRCLVEDLGGRIDFHSEPGPRTVFRVHLPERST